MLTITIHHKFHLSNLQRNSPAGPTTRDTPELRARSVGSGGSSGGGGGGGSGGAASEMLRLGLLEPDETRNDDKLRDEMAELGLLQGPADDAVGWGAVANLDVFFSNMYSFYHHHGLATILISGVSNLITLGFTVVFTTFLFAFVDWGLLLKCHDEASCHPLTYYVSSPMEKPSFFRVMVLIWFFLFAVYWLWTGASFATQARDSRSSAF